MLVLGEYYIVKAVGDSYEAFNLPQTNWEGGQPNIFLNLNSKSVLLLSLSSVAVWCYLHLCQKTCSLVSGAVGWDAQNKNPNNWLLSLRHWTKTNLPWNAVFSGPKLRIEYSSFIIFQEGEPWFFWGNIWICFRFKMDLNEDGISNHVPIS